MNGLHDIYFYSAWSDVIGVVINTVLALVVIYLTVRDKQKTQSLHELQEQTQVLKNSYFELLKPKFSITNEDANLSANKIGLYFQNQGNYGTNFMIDIDTSELNQYTCSYESFTTISPNYQGRLYIQNTLGDIDKKIYYVNFYFNDIIGRKFKQTLIINHTDERYRTKHRISTQGKAEFQPPELIQ